MGVGKKINKKVVIIGYVDLANENDKDSELIISSEDQNYTLLPNKNSEKLREMIGEEVQVSGNLSEDSEGQYQILVNTYESLEDDYDYDDDDDYQYKDEDDEEDKDY